MGYITWMAANVGSGFFLLFLRDFFVFVKKDYLKINLVVAYLFVFGLCIPLMQFTFIPISAINLSVTGALYCLFMMANFIRQSSSYF